MCNQRPVLPSVSGLSLRAAGTLHSQCSRRILSRSETSLHKQRAGRRPRHTKQGDSDPRGHWYQATQHESEGYRGRSRDRVGTEASLQTQEEGAETKAENISSTLSA